MVVGIDKFAIHFEPYRDRYVLIGGAATWLVLNEVGLDARATRDLDIVLSVEALDADFGRAFWEFVRAGGYQILQKSSGRPTFYRFGKPADAGFPAMLELFSRLSDGIDLPASARVTPVPLAEDLSSLSAILLDEDYYGFVHANKRQVAGVPIVTEVCLIPLKAKAWLDLSERKRAGGAGDRHSQNRLRSWIGGVKRWFSVFG